MKAHSFDRFYVVTKFIFLAINDFKFSAIKYDEKCEYLLTRIFTYKDVLTS